VKVGDLIKLINSTRKNGPYAGMVGLIVGFDPHDNPIVNVEGELKDFHYTQIENVLASTWSLTT
jgi:hypothetical protein